MTKRRVLVFNHFAVPRGYPGGTRHVELFGALPGWSCAIIAGRRNPITGGLQLPEPGFVPVGVLPYRSNGISRVLNWLSYTVTATMAGLRHGRPDVVYASSPHLLAALAGWFVARVWRARFVLEVRDLWPRVLVEMGQLSATSPIYRILERLERFLYQRADRIVVMAVGTITAIEAMGIPAERISYIPNAADPEDYAPSAPRAVLRRRYRFTRLTAVYAGAHGPANGLQLLLEAADDVRDLDIDIVLVGDGVDKTRLKAEARRRSLANVRFLDPVSKTEIPDLLHAADLGLHVLADVPLFRHAVSPNKVFDYMAAGLPLLTNVPGVVGDCVVGAGAGYVVEPRGLARGLRQVARESLAGATSTLATGGRIEALESIGGNGRSWIAANQSRDMMRRRLLRCLENEPDRSGVR